MRAARAPMHEVLARVGYSKRPARAIRESDLRITRTGDSAVVPRAFSHWFSMDLHTLWYVLAIALIIIGIVGTVLPVLPGVPIVFGGMLLAAWADHFAHIGTFTLVVLGVLTALALILDFVAGMLGAKRVGASRYAVVGAMLGTLFGIFLGLPGLLLGPFVGALLGELLAGGTLHKATGVGVGTWLGFVVGAIAKLGICFAMLGIFGLAFLVN